MGFKKSIPAELLNDILLTIEIHGTCYMDRLHREVKEGLKDKNIAIAQIIINSVIKNFNVPKDSFLSICSGNKKPQVNEAIAVCAILIRQYTNFENKNILTILNFPHTSRLYKLIKKYSKSQLDIRIKRDKEILTAWDISEQEIIKSITKIKS